MSQPDLVRRTYTRRQKIALDRPEHRPARDLHCTNDPHKRHVQLFQHGKSKLHLATSLSIILDDWPEWMATVGFIEPSGDWSDLKVERRLWTDDMWQAAQAAMTDLTTMPYDQPPVRSQWKTHSRPSELYVFWRVSPIERDMITASQSGFYEPMVKIRDPRWANEDDD